MRTGTFFIGRAHWARLLILASAGVVTGHRLAYWTAPHVHNGAAAHGHDGHGYLTYLGAVLIPLAAFVLARTAWLEHRHRVRLVSLRQLVALQAVLFIGQETVERAALGIVPAELLGERVLWAGLAAQLLVAGFLLGVVRGSRRAIPRLPALVSRPRPAVSFVRNGASARTVPIFGAFSPLSRRGPPIWSH